MRARCSEVNGRAGFIAARRRGRAMMLWLACIAALAAVGAGILLAPRWFIRPQPASAQPAQPAPVARERPAGEMPLVLQLPQPRFVGTPYNLKSPILEKPRTGPRPEMRIPAGATNVALHKHVTASDSSPTLGELAQVTDGDKEGIEGSYVEIGSGKQFFQVDLERPYRIYAIVVWHYHAQARIYHDVIVQVSSDPAFGSEARTLFNNDHDNTLGLGAGRDKEFIGSHEGLLIDAGGAAARYVRLWGNGNTENDLNHCTEIEVYGEPATAP